MKRYGCILLVMVVGAAAAAAPQAEVWPRWEAYSPDSSEVIDHGKWDRFLQGYLIADHVSGVHRLPYGSISRESRAGLQGYIRDMEGVEISQYTRDEQIAFWTNLYNAVTVELILEHYPVNSIRDIRISGPVFNRHPWDAELVRVEGVPLTLNDIEHRIMRPIWQDPRIHFAVNCASIGCPNLQPRAFTGETWDAMYTAAAREFINHPRGVDLSGRRPLFSSIFDWYQVDFGGSLAGVVEHVLVYAEPELEQQLREFARGGYPGRVRYEYDWDLNGL